jgi:cellulose 1,4-beta-cellobiosidase
MSMTNTRLGTTLGSLLLLTQAVACAAHHGAPKWTPTAKIEQPLAVPALSVPAPSSEPSPPINPFLNAGFYVDPHFSDKVSQSQRLEPELSAALDIVKRQPTALWLDRIAAISSLPNWLDAALTQAKDERIATVPVIVVYNLPNRDCAAKASSGELHIEEDGERRYRAEYIDQIALHLSNHSDQKVAIVLEPDSLPNLVSNMGVPKCAISKDVYMHSVAYAIAKLSLPNVSIYLDAAHAGWLGWEANQTKMMAVVMEVLRLAGGRERIRGFATNVANFNALEGNWGNELEPSNPAANELAYVRSLAKTAANAGLVNPGFLIDTSRNGRANTRTRWGNWCNIKGAGLGERPSVAPTELVDAYFWVKPPGESDGTSDPTADRFDENCASPDASPGAPEAGQWFHDYLVELVRNAHPAL